ncbi:tRNA1(Val) (adenine(37)-N6)-methyltransferase [Agrobacterium sp. rho-13.3]|uniref:tRNA1(Val) (adenine(37)-N6)-methyltransferase n=1 Tax=Agrobacterium sp. rho-13.3 TaxID=3072980 RepID=UPI002A130DC2|nr:methyltransferase [Agrobacterium sp. rho-13.3]MDX8310350.1 methyltransferase [Agrobacterium sp. rho-13.3]
MADTVSETIDAFHRGRFQILQPKGRGHRAGMDAMLLASLVADESACRVADLGAGAGAAGMAVASRLKNAQVTLFEMSPEMADFAQRSRELPANAEFAPRITVRQADVTLRATARIEAGLLDNHFHHVIMNPPYNDAGDRKTPDALKAAAHAMTDDLFEHWLRTAAAIMVPGGQLSLIARPQSIADIITASGRRFGGIEVTLIHPRDGEDAVRMLLTAIKGSRARLTFRAPLIMHENGSHAFARVVDDLSNGRVGYLRNDVRERK